MTSWNYDLVAAFSIAVVKLNVQISIHADLQFSLDDVHPPAALFFPTAAVKKTHSGSDNIISYMLVFQDMFRYKLRWCSRLQRCFQWQQTYRHSLFAQCHVFASCNQSDSTPSTSLLSRHVMPLHTKLHTLNIFYRSIYTVPSLYTPYEWSVFFHCHG